MTILMTVMMVCKADPCTEVVLMMTVINDLVMTVMVKGR